ncbi:hypothetical protein [Nitrosococcus wardiae]|uniref:Uncharacterized protein n=1 Tax=Nitrosococcus wardiae TaxID=1814290 RepID=A0A4V1AW47_9GAMM|nr:hypothetical protein [Nitrosococcus wardiae]QBQ55375.1 hypothetical protein E3U44_13285 [Nitrosococcus wardiae]
MDRKKKRVSDSQLSTIMKTWLLVIPAVIAIMGIVTFTGVWLSSQSKTSGSIYGQITSIDRSLLNDIRGNFRNTYLQFLQAKVDPGADAERVEQLNKRLDELALQEGEIIRKYDPTYVTSRSSTLETLLEILADVPYPIVFTISLVVGIFIFVVIRYTALFIISRRYTSSSDYVKEV